MAWIHGNNPVGQEIRIGRILCEAMYAINEKQAYVGDAKTVWTDVGADPAVNALAGLDVTIARKGTLVTEMRTAIENIMTIIWPRYVTAGGANYTKASLLTAAFGAADWCVLTGKDINDVQPISEILKAAELLVRIEDHLLIGQGNAVKKVDAVGGPTRAIAWAAVKAQAPGAAVPGPGTVWGAFVAGPTYWFPSLKQGYLTFNSAIPGGSALIKLSLRYNAVGILPLYVYKKTTSAPVLHKITAAQYAAPNYGDAPNLIHTFNLPVASGTEVVELDDWSWLATGANTYYFKTIPSEALTPFPNDATGYACCISVGGPSWMVVIYDPPMTYN